MAESTIRVTCGLASAVLHMELFTCPGRRQPCIEIDGKYITPVDLTYLGRKESLKNWKLAIRVNGVTIRKLMDSGSLDFYNHREVCSKRCPNYLQISHHISTPTQDTEDTKARPSPYTDRPSKYANTGVQQEPGGRYAARAANGTKSQSLFKYGTPKVKSSLPNKKTESKEDTYIVIEDEDTDDSDEDTVGSLLDESDLECSPASNASSSSSHASGPAGPSFRRMARATEAKRSKLDLVDKDFDYKGLNESFPVTHKISNTGSQKLWQKIADVGLLETVMDDVNTALDKMKTEMVEGDVLEQHAEQMSGVIGHLGLTDKLKLRLAQHETSTFNQDIIKQQMKTEELAKNEDRFKWIHTTYQMLDCLEELQRKEQKKRKPEDMDSSRRCYVDEDRPFGNTFVM